MSVPVLDKGDERGRLRKLCATVEAMVLAGKPLYASDLCSRGAAPMRIKHVFLGHAHAILCVPSRGGAFWATEFRDAAGEWIR